MKFMHRVFVVAIAVCMAGGAAQAAGKGAQIERQSWSFAGPFGSYDKAQLQRGFQVYKEVCAACHSLNRVAFRMLSQPGGPEFSEDAVKALAAEASVQDGPNDEGEMFERPGVLADYIPKVFPNKQAARVANGGAYPPDLSLINKARTVPAPEGVVTHVLTMGSDIVKAYQEQGADYLYALLTGYREELPEGVEQQGDLYYNASFPGNWIAMAQPLYDDSISYTDGTAATVSQQSKDVAAFLQWAADPHMEQRKQTGWVVLVYLLITAILLYVAKRRVWAGVKH